MRRALTVVGSGLLVLVAILVVFWARYVRVPAFEPPVVTGELVPGSVEVDGRARSFLVYRPKDPAPAPPVVFVLHASMGDAGLARWGFHQAFEPIADREGFLVVYPDGYERHWNGCRAAGPYAANLENIDDVAFFRAMVEQLATTYGIDRSRVFATGLSNGGHMAYRLALEAPDLVAAVAPVAASLPTDANLDCTKSGRPVGVLIVNGSADPMNPDAGGEAVFYGLFASRGDVLSSEATALYFAGLAGHRGPPRVQVYPDRVPDDESTAELRTWSDGPGPPVALLHVENGGHNVPHPRDRAPRILGPTNADIDAAEEIWRFLERDRERL